MNNKRINVTRSSMPPFEEYIEKIRGLWDNCWLSNRGAIHREFEELLKRMMGVPYPFLFANGHVALEVAIDALGLPKGGEVITTPYTHCSTTHAIVRNGLKPVFCDVNGVDYTIDVSQIEKYITHKTVAICAVHVYGNLCDVDAIDEIANKHHLKVIYDAAHAFGVKRNGIDVASFGDISMFSCHATKVFHTIEGGITVFKDKAIYDKINNYVNFGFDGPEEVKYISTNARMNEFEAAMGVCNLRHFSEEIVKRKSVYDKYVEYLSGFKGIKLIAPQLDVTPNYAYFPVFFDGYKYSRNEIQNRLAEHDVYARKYFYPIVTELACYHKMFQNIQMPIAKHASDTVLTLPMYADLQTEDVERICKIILD